MSETTRRERAELVSMRMNHASQVDELVAFADVEVARVLDTLGAQIRPLLEEIMTAHADPDDGAYNDCDDMPCAWCEDAAKVLTLFAAPEPTP